MKNNTINKGTNSYYVGFVCQFVLILTLGAAIIGKMIDPDTSIEFISAALGIGSTLSNVLLLATIGIESVVLVGLLLFGNHVAPYYATAILLSGFSLFNFIWSLY